MYVIFWGIWAVALFWIGIRKRNRPILQAVGTKPQGHNWKYLLFGLVLGFALNGFCILIAWLHHDIVPVSYTHLDVYKRQWYLCPSR